MNKLFLMLVILSTLYTIAKSDGACMDRSKHAYFCNDKWGVCKSRYHDHKELHRVPCTCPCWKYKTTKKCVYCGHYRDPQYNNHPGTTQTYPSIKFAECSPKQRPPYYITKRIKRRKTVCCE